VKTYLVFCSVGDNSRHRLWSGRDANFDLALCYYGHDKGRFSSDADRYYEKKGSKFQNFFDLYFGHREFRAFVKAHRYIGIFDDDLVTNVDTLNTFFEITDALEALMTQPALLPESLISYEMTRHVPGAYAVCSNFCEVGFPCFATDALDAIAHTFGETISGWGLDLIWPRLLDPTVDRDGGRRRIFIIQYTPVLHPKRTEGNPSEIDRLLPRRLHRKEGERILSNYDSCPIAKLATFGDCPRAYFGYPQCTEGNDAGDTFSAAFRRFLEDTGRSDAVSLRPRRDPDIEIEVCSGVDAGTPRSVVRVRNPAVLHLLLEARKLGYVGLHALPG
jgi:hypothetical protein